MIFEYDPVEEALIQRAAADALAILRNVDEATASIKYVRSGNTVFCLRLSIMTPEQIAIVNVAGKEDV